MAKSMVTRYSDASLSWGDLGGLFKAVARRFGAYMAYRRTVRELSALNGRDLADLGLHHSEIQRVAHDSIYGARR